MPVAIIADDCPMDDAGATAIINGGAALGEGECTWAGDRGDRRVGALPQQVYLRGGTSTTTTIAQPTGACMSSSSSSSSIMTIKHEREREGRCAECGVQTHEFHVDPLTYTVMKVPLNVQNEVHRGRCLLCYPVFPHSIIAQQQEARCYQQQRSHYHHHHHHNPPTSCHNNHDDHHHYRHHSASNNPSQPPSSPSSSSHRRRVAGHRLHSRYSTAETSQSWQPGRLHHYQQQQQQQQQQYGVDVLDKASQEALAVLQGPCFDIIDILAAMKHVPHNMQVQELGCERLWILTWEDDNAAAIGRVGGVSIILNAMARFPMNAHLQQCGCESIQNLALTDYNRREICEQAGVYLIVQAMMRHAQVAGIQQCGATALASLAVQKEYHSLIERAGGLHAVLVAAHNFADEECILRAVMEALQALGYDSTGRVTPSHDDDIPAKSVVAAAPIEAADTGSMMMMMMMLDCDEPNLVCSSALGD